MDLDEAREKMEKAIEILAEDLSTVQAGRATPGMIEMIRVEAYDTQMPLVELATISAPEPRLLTFRPFDPTSIKAIERAILASDLGLTPNNDGKMIRLNIPSLTEERRHELVRVVKNRTEEARVSVRNVRRDTQNDVREFEREKIISEDDLKRGEDELQKLTDHYIDVINQTGQRKETEVLEV